MHGDRHQPSPGVMAQVHMRTSLVVLDPTRPAQDSQRDSSGDPSVVVALRTLDCLDRLPEVEAAVVEGLAGNEAVEAGHERRREHVLQ